MDTFREFFDFLYVFRKENADWCRPGHVAYSQEILGDRRILSHPSRMPSIHPSCWCYETVHRAYRVRLVGRILSRVYI
jgi:hypothetical protein